MASCVFDVDKVDVQIIEETFNGVSYEDNRVVVFNNTPIKYEL